MSGVVFEAAKYRDMAARCRLLANGASTEQGRNTLLDMAEDFDKEADRLEAFRLPRSSRD